MTLLAINARHGELRLATLGQEPPEQALRRILSTLPRDAPVVIMLHGMGYCPDSPGRSPHDLLYAPRAGHARSRNISWPRRLGFALPGPRPTRGLCIGFGWPAAGTIWQATRAADEAASMLARLVQIIRRISPGRRVDLFGHSLGARVILGTVPLLAAGSLGRAFLLAGADFTVSARRALTTQAGADTEFFNIITRENDLFDFLFERVHAPLGGTYALGYGVAGHANWLDIQIDSGTTRANLARIGFPLAPPAGRVCHWSVYLRPGVFRLYRGLIHDRQRLHMGLMRETLAIPPDPRWARLLARRPSLPVLAVQSRGPVQ